MHRFRRIPLTALTVLLLLLCVAMVALWVSSYRAAYYVRAQRCIPVGPGAWTLRFYDLQTGRGAFAVSYSVVGTSDPRDPAAVSEDPVSIVRRISVDSPLDDVPRATVWAVVGMHARTFAYDHYGNPWRGWTIVLPYWLAVVATGFAPFRLLMRVARRRLSRRHTNGRCRACGYDLRATPDRCPECGTVPTDPRRGPV